MSIDENELPGVSKVRTQFQMLEDKDFAQKLWEEEVKELTDTNVHGHRRAKEDIELSKKLERDEKLSHQLSESKRKEQLRRLEEESWQHAVEVEQQLREQDARNRDTLVAEMHYSEIEKKQQQPVQERTVHSRPASETKQRQREIEREIRKMRLQKEAAELRLQRREDITVGGATKQPVGVVTGQSHRSTGRVYSEAAATHGQAPSSPLRQRSMVLSSPVRSPKRTTHPVTVPLPPEGHPFNPSPLRHPVPPSPRAAEEPPSSPFLSPEQPRPRLAYKRTNSKKK